MASTTSGGSPKNATENNNIIERMALRCSMHPSLWRSSEYNQVAAGITAALKQFREIEEAKNLKFVESLNSEIPKRKKQCKAIVDVFKILDCPTGIESTHLLHLNYDVLTPTCLWILQKSLLKEVTNFKNPMPFTTYFRQSFKSPEDSIKAFRESSIYKWERYENFKEMVSGNNSTSLANAVNIDQLNFDKEILALEQRLEAEANAYFHHRTETQTHEYELFCALTRKNDYDPKLYSNLLKTTDKLMDRLMHCKDLVHSDLLRIRRESGEHEPRTNAQGKTIVDMEYYQWVKLADYAKTLEGRFHDLVMKLAKVMTETLASTEHKAQIDKVDIMPGHKLETLESRYLPIDETIGDSAIDIYKRLRTFVQTHDPQDLIEKHSEQFYNSYKSYVSNINFKLSDLCCKANVMQHNRNSLKEKCDNLKSEMKKRQREEIIIAQKMNIALRVNMGNAEVNCELSTLLRGLDHIKAEMDEIFESRVSDED
ncbi:hypothetical protein L3Y34_013563 [Caenorhabditis briggsae]|uniref:CCDC93 N-terminal domain-containing protein n=1 Tax=Caenorhabditis briggsae TaxID=6238 RepID=A0AAE8ZRY7_CAEBR|nr:hypothetical protein L3Y34_013563 [Caenorhabditis briggsae]